MRKWLYLLSFSIPLATWVSLHLDGAYAFFALFYAFGALPLMEFFLPAPDSNHPLVNEPDLKSSPYFDGVLYLMVPIQYALLALFCQKMGNPALLLLDRLALISAMGVSCGVIGINAAHELGHRSGRNERVLSRALLLTSLNWQFYVEHNRGHHRNVSTPKDSESAWLNEAIYTFFVRSIRESFKGALKLDPNEMRLGLTLEAVLCALILGVFGAWALTGFLLSSLFGVLLLQSVNYIEHYGLSRKEISPGVFEPVAPHHSWNANQMLSRAILFELSRHSDHHAYASRKYPLLRHHDAAPQMPTGYPGMILLALIPPLWFKVMNPRVKNQVS